jgi:hypothetical protein
VKYLLDLERMRQDTEKLQMAGVSTDVMMKIERTARWWEMISSGLGIVFVSVWENVEGPAREAKDSGRIVCRATSPKAPSRICGRSDLLETVCSSGACSFSFGDVAPTFKV